MFTKRLNVERLEDRRMLAAFNVSNLNDSGPGSLRAAIGLANAAAGADTISFDSSLSGGTINLTSGELVLSESLTIDARPLATNIIINAHQLSRVINITPNTGNFTLGGLILTGGKTTAAGSLGYGGAIRSNTRGNLTVSECQIINNIVTGFNSGGGGIFSRSDLTVENSTIENNSTTREQSEGGGIDAIVGNVTITRSAIRGNTTAGDNAAGGGIWSTDNISITESTIADNMTTGTNSSGGGIGVRGALTLTRSTISNNSTLGANASGGGVFASGDVSLDQCTVSGNTTSGELSHGGGILIGGSISLVRSTITNNRVLGAGSKGAGIRQGDSIANRFLTSNNSILAGNRDSTSVDNFIGDPQGPSVINYSLIGTDVTVGTGTHNIVTNDPLLLPLKNNGGRTETHAPMLTSPAINAGDPSLSINPNEFDQRGAGFKRIVGGRIDLGAVEDQGGPYGDFDNDRDVDGRDFLRWQRGNSPLPRSGQDLALWQLYYGAVPSLEAETTSALIADESADSDNATDLIAIGALSATVTSNDSDSSWSSDQQYVETVDHALENLSTPSASKVREFGEIAVRPFGQCRMAEVDFELAEEADSL